MTNDEIVDDRAVMRLCKRQVEGDDTGLLKHQWMAIINGRATDLYGDASPRAFTKTITEDPVGRELFRALKRAPGNEVEAAPDKLDPETDEDRARAAGASHLKMHFLAVDQQRLTGRPYALAYTAVYSNRNNKELNNKELRESVHREHIEAAMRRMYG